MESRVGWPVYYVLLGKTPMAVDLITWAKAMEDQLKGGPDNNPWSVARTHVCDFCNVSTDFLGIDHNFFGDGDPLVFETMVFGGPLDRNIRRYSTWAKAEAGHEEMVTEARKAIAQVDAIARNAGAKERT